MTGFERFGVTPETLVLTSNGHEKISTLEGQEVEIWNGKEFEQTSVFKVAENKRIVRITTSTGSELACSEDYTLLTQPGFMPYVIESIPASALEIGERLTKAESFPVVTSGDKEFPHAYTHGFYMGNERYHRRDGALSKAVVYGNRRPILEDLHLDLEKTDKNNLYFPSDLPGMWELPLDSGYSLNTRLEWLAGLFDGGLLKRKSDPKPIWHLYSNSGDFLSQVKLLIQTLGGDTRVVPNKDLSRLPYSLRMSGSAVQSLLKLEVPSIMHKFPTISYKRRGIETPKIMSVEDDYRTSDVYNFVGTEGKAAIFNGIYTSSN